jgi:hypothetical protein
MTSKRKRKPVMERRLAKLADMAVAQSSKARKELVYLAMSWDNDVGSIVDSYFGLPHPPSDWKETPKWAKEWNKKAKEIVGF